MKKLKSLIFYGGLLIGLVWGSFAHAFEFDLHAHMLWRYEWYGQRGKSGFFGPYNIDNGSDTRTSNFNFWNGGQFDTNITTSSSAGWSYFEVEFEPSFRVNQAIRVNGKYRIAGYGEPVNEDYLTENAPGLNTAISEGQWTLFWLTAQTPWGQFAIGKRPWSFGMGLQYNGSGCEWAHATTESILLNVPYGPLDIGIAFYPFRFAGTSSNDLVTTVLGDPYNLPQYVTAGGTVVPGQYYSRADGSGAFSKDFLVFVQYSSGPVHSGILGSYGSYQIGREALIDNPDDPLVTGLVPQDSKLFHGTAYSKYNNGRFFFNGEAAWVYWTDHWHTTQPIRNPLFPDQFIIENPRRYVEQWRYAAEWGWFIGPMKLSLFQAWTPGPDRRNGVLNRSQPALFVHHPDYDTRLGNHGLFRPYSWIFARDYGSGLNAYTLAKWGYIRDALVLAARLDYAVAANLNIGLSLLRADRTSRGYSWGCIGPNAGRGRFQRTPDGNMDLNINRYPDSPDIPDGALGTEIVVSMHWKLLEELVLGINFAYWKPGAWFSYACIDRSVPGWENGTSANLWGTKPMRSIDPIVGGEFTLRIDL